MARLLDPAAAAPLAAFLAKAPEPPLPQAVALAVALLQDIGALTPDEALTTLGRHLAALPLPPQLGKLILHGLLFRCLGPIVTIACAMSYRSAPGRVSTPAARAWQPPAQRRAMLRDKPSHAGPGRRRYTKMHTPRHECTSESTMSPSAARAQRSQIHQTMRSAQSEHTITRADAAMRA